MANGNGNGAVVKIAIAVIGGVTLMWIGWVSAGIAGSSENNARILRLEEKTAKLEAILEQLPSMQIDVAVIKETIARWDREKRFERKP